MRILIFHIGALGDTLVSVPLLKKVRQVYADAEVVVLSERRPAEKRVTPADVLGGSGLVDRFITYPVCPAPIRRLLSMAPVYFKLWRFDVFIYLVPSARSPRQVFRDKLFFGLTFPRKKLGFEGPYLKFSHESDNLHQPVEHESRLILKRFENTPLEISALTLEDFVIEPSEDAQSEYKRWRSRCDIPSGSGLIAVAVGARMQSKIWPADRYQAVLERLIAEFSLYPLFFGGSGDRSVSEHLRCQLGRGTVVCGELGIQASIEAMKSCMFYLGNDTGTMHMAVAAGLVCVAVFSSRDYPGKWYPFGHHHHVLRSEVPCSGCMLTACENMVCLEDVQPESVFQACCDVLARRHKADESQTGKD